MAMVPYLTVTGMKASILLKNEKKEEAEKISSAMKDLLSSRYLNWTFPQHHYYQGPHGNRSVTKVILKPAAKLGKQNQKFSASH